MKYLILLVTHIIIFFHCFGQEKELQTDKIDYSKPFKLITTSVEKVKLQAEKDINNGTPFLLIRGGIATLTLKTDSIFENRYKVYYYKYGCTSPGYEKMATYNFIIFDHLLEKYGKQWKRTIRGDVAGLRDWKRKKRKRCYNRVGCPTSNH